MEETSQSFTKVTNELNYKVSEKQLYNIVENNLGC